MDRRTFFRLGAAGAIALPGLRNRMLADQEIQNVAHRTSSFKSPISRAPDLVRKALRSKISAFPTVEPIFAGSFLPGGKVTQLISANGFAAFDAQVQNLAGQGWRLASFTAIRNMNATWYYASFQQASANYILFQTYDPNAFQQMFAANQAGYQLVDFSITWEQNQFSYVGYWIAVNTPAAQTLVWGLPYPGLSQQWTTLSQSNNRMVRVQGFPSQELSLFSALFDAGTGSYVLWNQPMPQFSEDVINKWSGYTLVGLGYDTTSGNMTGCWRGLVQDAQFVWNQDWPTLQATAQEMAANGLILSAVSAYPNAPDFDDYFALNLAPFVMGYAYAVAKNGQVIANGYGYARGPHETANANEAFTANSRCNLASISKAVTGIALELLIERYPNITLDMPFWPLISSMVPNPDPSVKLVTLRNLATMYSGLQTPSDEGPLSGNLWPYLNLYLSTPLVGTPGVTYSYNNENFTILQGVIDQVTGVDYVTWVTENVLTPAGIDTSIFSDTPDPQTSATLTYSGPADPLPGYYWTGLNFVAPGGWISNANELVKILTALRATSVIPLAASSEMFTDGIGWFSFAGNYGTYYQKDGGLHTGAAVPQTLNTCVVRLAEGYDIALVANTAPPTDVVNLCAGAFDSRGLLTTDQPPAISTIVGAATYLPKAAPGAYCSITGSGFTDQPATDWGSSITGPLLPDLVAGISARVNGEPAFIEYVSATQVNILLPANVAPGTVGVDLATPTGVMSATLAVAAVAPGLFCYTLHGVLYPSSVYATANGAVIYVAAAGALPGYTSRPAAPGDIIELYATGCGQTSPAAPDGVVLTQAYPAANLAAFQVTIGQKAASVLYAALVGPGLWLVNVVIPPGLVGGDQALTLTVNNAASQPNVMITLLGG